MKTLQQVKAEYLAKALATTPPAFGYIVNGEIRESSMMQGVHAERCSGVVVAKVNKKYVSDVRIQDDAPITVVSKPEGFLGDSTKIMAFTTPSLGTNNLKIKVIEKSFFTDDLTVEFPEGHNFAVKYQSITDTYYRSTINGKWYLEADLPEQDDAQATAKYAQDVKAERNARISDTDKYEQLQDITVKRSAEAKRSSLTAEERAEVLAYRSALRDFPEVDGFPFVEYPIIPECIAYECNQAIVSREAMQNMNGGY